MTNLLSTLLFPLVDLRVMAGEKDFWHTILFLFPYEYFGASVDLGARYTRGFEGFGLAQYTGNKARYRVYDRRRWQFPTREHVRSHGNFLSLQYFLHPCI